MESLKHTFFEDPLYVYLLLGLAEVLLAALWRQRRTRALAAWLLVPPLAAGAVLTVERMVVTDRETLTAISEDIARKLQACDLDGVGQYLADDFRGYYRSKADALQAGRQAVRTFGVRAIRIADMRIEIQDDLAHMTLRTIIDAQGDLFQGSYPIRWSLQWAKRNGKWLILAVDAPGGIGS